MADNFRKKLVTRAVTFTSRLSSPSSTYITARSTECTLYGKTSTGKSDRYKKPTKKPHYPLSFFP